MIKNSTLEAILQNVETSLALLRGYLEGKEDCNFPKIILEQDSVRQPQEEIELPRKFKNTHYKTQGIEGTIRQKQNGIYEIRYRKKGYDISVSSKILKEAKQSFDEIVAKRLSVPVQPKTKTRVTFIQFADMWIRTVKKASVKENTYKNILSLYNAHINKYFQNVKFVDMTPIKVQEFLNGILETGKSRTVLGVKTLLSQIMDGALGEGLIDRNPVNFIKLPKHEYKNGCPISKNEELFLLANSPEPITSAMKLLLYTGCRRSELKTITLKDGFVIIKNAKTRKGCKVTYRKVPITPILEKNLSLINLESAKTISENVLSKHIKKFLPEHHLHDLRHTFITRCQECGVAREVVSIWAGHAADKSMTSTVYTHFDDEYMLLEAKKVIY